MKRVIIFFVKDINLYTQSNQPHLFLLSYAVLYSQNIQTGVFALLIFIKTKSLPFGWKSDLLYKNSFVVAMYIISFHFPTFRTLSVALTPNFPLLTHSDNFLYGIDALYINNLTANYDGLRLLQSKQYMCDTMRDELQQYKNT